MRFNSILATAGVLAALAAFTSSPAFAQPKTAAPAVPVCANCHAKSADSIMLTAHGATNDANGAGVPDVPRRRHGAPEGPEQGKADQRAQQSQRDGRRDDPPSA